VLGRVEAEDRCGREAPTLVVVDSQLANGVRARSLLVNAQSYRLSHFSLPIYLFLDSLAMVFCRLEENDCRRHRYGYRQS
jgi:hypothetical protein